MCPSGHIGYILHILDCLGQTCFYGYCSMGPRGRFYPYLYHCDYIGLLGTGFMQVFQLGRAPRTKETLPDFLKWRRVTRHPLVFRGLTGSQRTPGFGASQTSQVNTLTLGGGGGGGGGGHNYSK